MRPIYTLIRRLNWLQLNVLIFSLSAATRSAFLFPHRYGIRDLSFRSRNEDRLVLPGPLEVCSSR